MKFENTYNTLKLVQHLTDKVTFLAFLQIKHRTRRCQLFSHSNIALQPQNSNVRAPKIDTKIPSQPQITEARPTCELLRREKVGPSNFAIAIRIGIRHRKSVPDSKNNIPIIFTSFLYRDVNKCSTVFSNSEAFN